MRDGSDLGSHAGHLVREVTRNRASRAELVPSDGSRGERDVPNNGAFDVAAKEVGSQRDRAGTAQKRDSWQGRERLLDEAERKPTDTRPNDVAERE